MIGNSRTFVNNRAAVRDPSGNTEGMRTRSVVVVFGALTALFASGYGVMFTVLDEFRDEYGIGEGALGLIVAMGFLSSFLAQVTLAPLADRGHARTMIVLGMVFNVVGLLGMAYGSTFIVLLTSRFVMGVGVGLAYPAARRIVILADPDRLGQNLGRMLAADVAGFAVGPAISAVRVGPFGIAAPFLLIAALTVVMYPLIARTRVRDETDATAELPPRFAFDLLRTRPYLSALSMGAAVFMMIGAFDALWVLVLDDLNASDLIANLGITLFAVPMVLFASIGGRLAQRVGPFRLGTFGLLVGAAAMFAMAMRRRVGSCSRSRSCTPRTTVSPSAVVGWPWAWSYRVSVRQVPKACSVA